MTDMDEVIAEVARKNGVGLREDDLVMTLVTIMNRITNDQTIAMKKTLEEYQRSHEQIAHRWRQDATDRAEQILNAALKASREAMSKGMTEGAAQVIALIRDETNRALALQEARLAERCTQIRHYSEWILRAGVFVGGGMVICGILRFVMWRFS